MAIENKIQDFEQDICKILSQLAYHIHPTIIKKIQDQNVKDTNYFTTLFSDRVNISHYIFENSACVFPSVRRYVSGIGSKRNYNTAYNAIIDDNTFPRHIWCFLMNGKAYSGPNWKKSGLGEFELAHIFTHKESEVLFEKKFFHIVNESLFPYSDFSCACNVILLPKGTVRPTDNSPVIKAVFYKRYIDLYGEGPLNGRKQFNESLVPKWYNDLVWNDPFLPDQWEVRIDKLLAYRKQRITQILSRTSR